ncbi:MAG TPA: hypothetical protein VEX86_12895 [Longimicrobium sp.]|nr:hypothetical protein [Longimicrobium sp.]
MVVIGLVVGGLFILMFVGMIAALVIPAFFRSANRINEEQGATLLKWAYAAEQSYHADRGAYARHPAQLPSEGRLDRSPFFPYELEISAASDRELCLEAVPRPTASPRLHALSMDAQGTLYRAAGCRGDREPSVGVSRASEDASAKAMLRQSYEGIVAYHERAGEYPRELADIVTRVRFTQAMAEFRFEVVRADGNSVCVALFPTFQRADLHTYSVDHDGNLYRSPRCIGDVVERFTAKTSADGASSDMEKPAVEPTQRETPSGSP